MCGIVGFVDWREAPDPELLKNMILTLRHRGPISGQEIADAYHKRVAGQLRGTTWVMQESPWAD